VLATAKKSVQYALLLTQRMFNKRDQKNPYKHIVGGERGPVRVVEVVVTFRLSRVLLSSSPEQ